MEREREWRRRHASLSIFKLRKRAISDIGFIFIDSKQCSSGLGFKSGPISKNGFKFEEKTCRTMLKQNKIVLNRDVSHTKKLNPEFHTLRRSCVCTSKIQTLVTVIIVINTPYGSAL